MERKAALVPWRIWWRLVRELRSRGDGVRESGAFLLGRRSRDGGVVSEIIFYDDIDHDALARGYVHLSGSALAAVWDRCAAAELEVLADVHTHPGGSGQSESDRDHPMVSARGHTALIIPRFARSMFNLRAIGVYHHLGSRQWRTLPSPRAHWRGVRF